MEIENFTYIIPTYSQISDIEIIQNYCNALNPLIGKLIIIACLSVLIGTILRSIKVLINEGLIKSINNASVYMCDTMLIMSILYLGGIYSAQKGYFYTLRPYMLILIIVLVIYVGWVFYKTKLWEKFK
jgi:hypothetical protein